MTFYGCVHSGEYLARYEIGCEEAAIKSIEAAGGTVVQHIEGLRVLAVRNLAETLVASLSNDPCIMYIEVCRRRQCL